MDQDRILAAATDDSNFPQDWVVARMDCQSSHGLVIGVWHGFQYLDELLGL